MLREAISTVLFNSTWNVAVVLISLALLFLLVRFVFVFATRNLSVLKQLGFRKSFVISISAAVLWLPFLAVAGAEQWLAWRVEQAIVESLYDSAIVSRQPYTDGAVLLRQSERIQQFNPLGGTDFNPSDFRIHRRLFFPESLRFESSVADFFRSDKAQQQTFRKLDEILGQIEIDARQRAAERKRDTHHKHW